MIWVVGKIDKSPWTFLICITEIIIFTMANKWRKEQYLLSNESTSLYCYKQHWFPSKKTVHKVCNTSNFHQACTPKENETHVLCHITKTDTFWQNNYFYLPIQTVPQINQGCLIITAAFQTWYPKLQEVVFLPCQAEHLDLIISNKLFYQYLISDIQVLKRTFFS